LEEIQDVQQRTKWKKLTDYRRLGCRHRAAEVKLRVAEAELRQAEVMFAAGGDAGLLGGELAADEREVDAPICGGDEAGDADGGRTAPAVGDRSTAAVGEQRKPYRLPIALGTMREGRRGY
jgi:hypothetical protein